MRGETKKTILLVEDEAIIAMQETKRLEKAGYGVVQSSTGEMAIDIVNRDPGGIDLILMDIDLGKGIDGTEAAERILRTKDLPILFLSSHMEPEIVRKTEEITNYGYVVKSSVFAVLDASIKMALKLFSATKQLDLDSMEITETNEELRASLSALRSTNDALALSEDKFSKAFHANPDSININRLSDGVYIDVNRGFTSMTGYSKEDVMGHSSLPEDLGIWVDRKDRDFLVRGLQENGEVLNLEAEFRRKDGSVITGMMSAHIIEVNGEKCLISITKDITERKSNEGKMRDQNQLLGNILDQFPGRVFWKDMDLVYQGCNKTEAKRANLSSTAEIVGKTDYDLPWTRDETERYRGIDRKILESGRPVMHVEQSRTSRDGRIEWEDYSKLPLYDSNGDISGVFGVAIDITDRKRIEDDLRNSELTYKNFFDNAPFGIIQKNLDGEVIKVNAEYVRILGYPTIEAYLRIERNRRGTSPGSDNLEGKWIKTTDKCSKPDGNRLTLSRASRRLPDSPEVIEEIIEDITDKMNAEKALRETNETFSLFVRHSPVLTYIKEIVDDEDRMLYASDNHMALLGIAGSEITGKTMVELFPEQLARQIVEDDLVVVKSGNAINKKENILGREFATIKFPIVQDERTLLAGFSIDITEKERDDKLIKKLLDEKEIILQEVHHRIKNNMNIVKSLLHLQARSISDEKAISAFSDTEHRLDSMIVLYEELYGTSTFGELSIRKYLSHLVDETVMNFPGRERISIAKEIEDFNLDVKRLLSVGIILNELLTNIMKYAFIGKNRGKIDIISFVSGNLITIAIKDDGNGIPENVDFENSTGFGLTLVKMMTKQIDGTIKIERGTGTNVVLEFER
jgi:PAS domain S-box-containing protein